MQAFLHLDIKACIEQHPHDPVEIKKTAQPATAMAKNFPTLKEIPGMQLGSGCILCLAEKLVKTSEMLSIVPIEYI